MFELSGSVLLELILGGDFRALSFHSLNPARNAHDWVGDVLLSVAKLLTAVGWRTYLTASQIVSVLVSEPSSHHGLLSILLLLLVHHDIVLLNDCNTL